jgi:hypothetical protein
MRDNVLEVGKKIKHPDWKFPQEIVLIENTNGQIVTRNRNGWLALYFFKIEDNRISLDADIRIYDDCLIVE